MTPQDMQKMTDEEWEAYISTITDSCGMEELLQVYQDAYDRYVEEQKAE